VKHAEVGSVDGMHQSKIYALNNQGQAVGTFRPHMSGYHALLWNVETDEVEDLNRCLPPEQQWPKGDSSPSPSYWTSKRLGESTTGTRSWEAGATSVTGTT
jgi:hypothetical protein